LAGTTASLVGWTATCQLLTQERVEALGDLPLAVVTVV
jgi:hypothetical protein